MACATCSRPLSVSANDPDPLCVHVVGAELRCADHVRDPISPCVCALCKRSVEPNSFAPTVSGEVGSEGSEELWAVTTEPVSPSGADNHPASMVWAMGRTFHQVDNPRNPTPSLP